MKKYIIGGILMAVLIICAIITIPILSALSEEAAEAPIIPISTDNRGSGEYINKVDETAMKISNDFELKWDEKSQGFIIADVKTDSSEITIPTSFSTKPIVGIAEGAFSNKNVDKVIIPDSLKIDEKINLDLPVREGYTFVGWTEEIKDGQKIYVTNWKQIIITYNSSKTAISVNDTVSAELFGAVCYDNVSKKNIDAEIQAEIIGEIEAGKAISVKLSAKDCKSITIENVKVYGDIKVVMASYIMDTVDINTVATVTDSFGEKLVPTVTCDGEMVGGNKVGITVKATDAAGNSVENSYIYDVHSDKDKNHWCDFCENVLSDCNDADKDHACDYCGESIGTHIDLEDDGNHLCEYCNKAMSECIDVDCDHSCDECFRNIGTHIDVINDGDHICEYCKKNIGGCYDENLDHSCDECTSTVGKHKDNENDGDHLCEHCKKAEGDCVDSNVDHVCDECKNIVGTHSDIEFDGDHLCEYCGKSSGECSDVDSNHICDECGKYVGVHADIVDDGDHLCEYCGQKIGECYEVYKDHKCDECEEAFAEHSDADSDGNHRCDYCGDTMNSCITYDKNHICDECKEVISGCYDDDKNHYCDVCEFYMGSHYDSKRDGDHNCDYCGQRMNECYEVYKNHKCDECEEPFEEHSDADGDGNHRCDHCNDKITFCVDDDKNHICEECGGTISGHYDEDRNHFCDVCEWYMGSHYDPERDGDHNCNYCSQRMSECFEVWKDHKCDECEAPFAEHKDRTGDADHRCDYCGDRMTSCADENKNHNCDECGANVGEHSDRPSDGDHACEYCLAIVTKCSDGDDNGYCDECNKGIFYTVKYNANGGVGTMSSSKHVYGIANNLTANQFTRNGYIFAGWNTESNGTGIDYFNNESVKDLVNVGDSITLYAMWNVDPYTISKYVLTGTMVSDTKGINKYFVYTTIDSTPFSLKYNTIIDWSNENITDLLKHTNRTVSAGRFNNIDIGNTSTSVTFIGARDKIFTNLKLHICNFFNGQKLTLRFVNFNFITNESCAIGLYEDGGVDLTIEIVGENSISSSVSGGSIIGESKLYIKNLTFVGDGVMNIAAGHGADGANSSDDGADGGTAVYAETLVINIENSLMITGGNGGNGVAGAAGADGTVNGNATLLYTATGIFGAEIQSIFCYDKAYGGSTGDKGGSGGNAGRPIEYSKFVTDGKGTINLVFGDGGNGAKGGNGGNGGDGADFYGYVKGFSYLVCYNPGLGGDAGNGGAGGDAGHSVTVEYNFAYENIHIIRGKDGTPGEGGDPGNAGSGGDGGEMHATKNDHYADAAGDGNSGVKGEAGNP